MRSITLLIVLLLGATLVGQGTSDEIYGNNRLAIAPVLGYGSSSFNDFGVGIAFEHYFNSKVAIQGDFAAGLEHEMIQIMVGPKFYPRDHDKPVSYAIAPVFFVLQGEEIQSGHSFIWPDIYYPRSYTFQQFGFMLVNSVNMTLSEKVYFGIEAGLGINYVNRFKTEAADEWDSEDLGGNRLFRISMGYRF